MILGVQYKVLIKLKQWLKTWLSHDLKRDAVLYMLDDANILAQVVRLVEENHDSML